jgi:hypothetical protein
MNRRGFLTGLLASTALARGRARKPALTFTATISSARAITISRSLYLDLLEHPLEPVVEGRLGSLKGFQLIS